MKTTPLLYCLLYVLYVYVPVFSSCVCSLPSLPLVENNPIFLQVGDIASVAVKAKQLAESAN